MLHASPLSLFQHVLNAWHPSYMNTLLASAALMLVLLRVRAESNLLRNVLVFIVIAIALILGSGISAGLGFSESADVMDEIASLVLGVLLIRLSGLTIFRALLPGLGLNPPRILEDILIVLAYIGWGMARLRYAGLDLGSLVATSAVITGIIAFSMQDTLGNILGGIALQLDNSIHIGDWIKVDEVSGRVIEVHWRHTAVRTRNGEIVVLPNSLLMKAKFTVVSRDDTPQWRRWVYFSVGYQMPPQKVISAVEKALVDADILYVSHKPAPQCIVMDYKDGATLYAVRYWLTHPQFDDPTDSTIRIHIYAALQRQGYVLAHPCMDINITDETDEQRSHAHEKEIALRQKTLRRIELFSKLSNEEVAHLANSLTYAQFARGDVITRQGAVAHWLYVLISGEADVWFESPGQPRRLLTTLPTGRIFGEMGLMTGQPRRATVSAHTDAECYRIDKKYFEQIMQSRPELAEDFALVLTERNKQLVEVQNTKTPIDHDQQHANLLASIKNFFRLEG